MATQKEVGQHLDLSDRTVREYLDKGIFSGIDGDRKRLDLDACRLAYINHLREVAAGRRGEDADDSTPDLATERALLAREQRANLRRKNRILDGNLLVASEVDAAATAVLSLLRTALLRLPSKVEPSNLERRAVLMDHIHEALEELARWEIKASPSADPDLHDEDPAGGDGLPDGP